ncbi:hypothetical protein HYALB_00013052 [Hymenoscyphus albidus]|uniref:Uncharacterized protein n=1 Tax=Hymenoscyphus albidus TaxID=595503 RepID=A0A9N9LYN3_9HELO|nr:hypothetical protein HYALB_00013052 [Hymenoscyphus albidus]
MSIHKTTWESGITKFGRENSEVRGTYEKRTENQPGIRTVNSTEPPIHPIFSRAAITQSEKPLAGQNVIDVSSFALLLLETSASRRSVGGFGTAV